MIIIKLEKNLVKELIIFDFKEYELRNFLSSLTISNTCTSARFNNNISIPSSSFNFLDKDDLYNLDVHIA